MKRRLEHLWYYYKWYILCGLLGLAVLIDYGWKIMHTVDPDYQIAFVTTEYMSEKDKEDASNYFLQYIKDKNGDGKKNIEIYQYRYDGDTKKTSNADEFMAAAVQLAVDMKENGSLWYVTDCLELLTGADPTLKKLGYWKEVFTEQKEAGRWENLCVLSRTEEGQTVWNDILNKKREG